MQTLVTFLSPSAPQDPQINSAGVRVAELSALPPSSVFSWRCSQLLLLEAGLRQAPSPDLVILPRSKARDLCLGRVCASAGLTCVSRRRPRSRAGPWDANNPGIAQACLQFTGCTSPAPCTALLFWFGASPALGLLQVKGLSQRSEFSPATEKPPGQPLARLGAGAWLGDGAQLDTGSQTGAGAHLDAGA